MSILEGYVLSIVKVDHYEPHNFIQRDNRCFIGSGGLKLDNFGGFSFSAALFFYPFSLRNILQRPLLGNSVESGRRYPWKDRGT